MSNPRDKIAEVEEWLSLGLCDPFEEEEVKRQLRESTRNELRQEYEPLDFGGER